MLDALLNSKVTIAEIGATNISALLGVQLTRIGFLDGWMA